MSNPAFDPLGLLRALQSHRVRFVVIGGLAGRLWGSPTVTNDLDVCYARDAANLEALATALTSLEARLRGVADDVPFLLDAETLRRGDHFTLVTRAGNLDLLGSPAGSGGYEALHRTAEIMEITDLRVEVSSLRDLIRMKRAAARRKDLIEVEILSAVMQEREAGE